MFLAMVDESTCHVVLILASAPWWVVSFPLLRYVGAGSGFGGSRPKSNNNTGLPSSGTGCLAWFRAHDATLSAFDYVGCTRAWTAIVRTARHPDAPPRRCLCTVVCVLFWLCFLGGCDVHACLSVRAVFDCLPATFPTSNHDVFVQAF